MPDLAPIRALAAGVARMAPDVRQLLPDGGRNVCLVLRICGAMFAPFAALPASAADVALGEYLSAACVTCHQLSGRSAAGIPPITGLPEDVFIDALRAYKTGVRDNPVMRNIAAPLTEEEMAALAAFFAAQKPQ